MSSVRTALVIPSCRRRRRAVQAASLAAVLATTTAARAQLVQAEPLAPIVAQFPAGAPPRETQVALQLVIDETGGVESAVVISRLPADTPDAS